MNTKYQINNVQYNESDETYHLIQNKIKFSDLIEEFEKPKQKQPVKLGIRMKAYPLKGEELKIFSVQKKSDSYKKLKAEDLIYSINFVLVNTREEYDKEIKKVLWGESVLFSILRNNKKISFKIKSKSFHIGIIKKIA